MLDSFSYLIAVLLSTCGIFAFHMFLVFLLKGHMFLVFLLKGLMFLVDIDIQWQQPFILIYLCIDMKNILFSTVL